MEIHLAEYIKAPEKLGRDSLDELRQLVEKYPYFQPARLLYLRNLYQLHDASFDKELRRASLFLPDRAALFLFIEGHNYRFELGSRYETASIETADEDRTNSLIDNFLSKLPEEKEKGRRQKPVDISTDYMAYLMQTGDMQDIVAPRMQHQDLIDDFIGHGDRTDSDCARQLFGDGVGGYIRGGVIGLPRVGLLLKERPYHHDDDKQQYDTQNAITYDGTRHKKPPKKYRSFIL